MSAIITSKFRINNAEQFLESFTEANFKCLLFGNR